MVAAMDMLVHVKDHSGWSITLYTLAQIIILRIMIRSGDRNRVCLPYSNLVIRKVKQMKPWVYRSPKP
jgi:hypothetical protein